jgi:hypothetical protein
MFSRPLADKLNPNLNYLAGYAYDPDCMYINGSGRDYYEFYIQLNRCGTLGKNSLHEDSRKNPTVSRQLSVSQLRNVLHFISFLSYQEKLHVEHGNSSIQSIN